MLISVNNISLQAADQVVVGSDGKVRRTSVSEVFSQFDPLVQAPKYVVPLETNPSGGGYQYDDAPKGLRDSMRSNPLFDAGAMNAIFDDGAASPTEQLTDGESDVSGLEEESDFKGFELSENAPPKPHVTSKEEQENFDGFGNDFDEDAENEEAISGFGSAGETLDRNFKLGPLPGYVASPQLRSCVPAGGFGLHPV